MRTIEVTSITTKIVPSTLTECSTVDCNECIYNTPARPEVVQCVHRKVLWDNMVNEI